MSSRTNATMGRFSSLPIKYSIDSEPQTMEHLTPLSDHVDPRCCRCRAGTSTKVEEIQAASLSHVGCSRNPSTTLVMFQSEQ